MTEETGPDADDGRLARTVRGLSVDDLAVVFGRAGPSELAVVGDRCGVRLRPGKARANAALVAPRLAGLPRGALGPVARALTAGPAAEVGPGPWPGRLGKVVAGLLRSWPARVVGLWVVLAADPDGEAHTLEQLLGHPAFGAAFEAAGNGTTGELTDLVAATGLDPGPFLATASDGDDDHEGAHDAGHDDDGDGGGRADPGGHGEVILEGHPPAVVRPGADLTPNQPEPWRDRMAEAAARAASTGGLAPADALDVVVEALAAQTAAGHPELLPAAVLAAAGRAGTDAPADPLVRWFHLGLLDGVAATGQPPPAGGPATAAWRAGRLVAARRADVQVATGPWPDGPGSDNAADGLAELLAAPAASGFAADVLMMLLDVDPVGAARLAGTLRGPFPGWEGIVAAGRRRAASLAAAGDLLTAEAVTTELAGAVAFWATDGPAASAAFSLVAVTLRRRRHDWAGARRLLDRVRPLLGGRDDLAQAALEDALIAAQVADPRALRLPRTRAEADALATRVRPVLAHLRAVADLAPDAPEPPLLAGLVAWADGDDDLVVDQFGRAEALAGPADPELLAALRFERARAQLRLLEPGSHGGAVAAAHQALAAGHPAGEAELVEVVAAAESLEQPGRWRLALARLSGLSADRGVEGRLVVPVDLRVSTRRGRGYMYHPCSYSFVMRRTL